MSSFPTLTTKATYDQRGLKVTATDAQNQVTSYANDEAGRLTTTTSPAITTTPGTGATATVYPVALTGYNTFGDRTEAEDANGHITATAYDRDGRKTGTTLPSYNGTSATTTTPWTYDAEGDVLSETDAKGETDYAYDQLGDLVKQTNPAISISGTATRGALTSTYLAGNRLTETSPYGSVTHHTYDALGRDSSTWAYVYTSTSAQTKLETDTAYTRRAWSRARPRSPASPPTTPTTPWAAPTPARTPPATPPRTPTTCAATSSRRPCRTRPPGRPPTTRPAAGPPPRTWTPPAPH
ncbi:hypothetical protein OG426_39605 [Streptomyces canus]|uniref:hypothetical protein n=1 Tax=Streptomyces canus TaxID=58343 RepID=UPI003864CACE|nr:hypothetical protein OG426_39605 [Streptomyces canus]